MSQVLRSQHRLAYSLLKPAARVAASFGLSFRIFSDLLRLAYFEVLSVERDLPLKDIAARFGQTDRHMRSLARRMESDFFDPERDVGLPREIESFVSQTPASRAEIRRRFKAHAAAEIERAIESLLSEGRLSEADGKLTMSQKYVVLSSDRFSNRIDALNHFLDGATQAVFHRLVYDEADVAMIKTLTFSADRADLIAFVRRLEAELRVELSAIDEKATFDGHADDRFTLSLTLAPVRPKKDGDEDA